jgi:hypothetical protein
MCEFLARRSGGTDASCPRPIARIHARVMRRVGALGQGRTGHLVITLDETESIHPGINAFLG